MDYVSIFFQIFGGLAVFLFGLRFLSQALKRVAGEKLKKLIEKLTRDRIRSAGVGALTTAIVQSSSMTMVTLIGFLNAGLIELQQAVWVMLGAEIGTTVTAQIIAFKIGLLFFPIMAIGFFISFFAKSQKYKNIGDIIFGFGLIFLGMETMSSGVSPLKEAPFFEKMLSSFAVHPLLGVIAGAIFTGIIQSSSATTGLVIAMGSAGIITLPAAISLIFGANIGTTITAQIASIGSRLSSKRLAFVQLMVNILGVLLFLPFIFIFADFIAMTSPQLTRQIANAHSVFNIIVTAIMLPLSGLLVMISKKAIKGSEPKFETGLKYVNESLLAVPSIAVMQCRKEVERMANIALKMVSLSKTALLKGDLKTAKHLPEKEETVDEIKEKLFFFLKRLEKYRLSAKDKREVAKLKNHVIDIERVADHANNLFELAHKRKEMKIVLSKKELPQLKEYFSLAIEAYAESVKAIKTGNKKFFKKVLENERKLDALQEKYESIHLKSKKTSDALFLQAVANIERISDHAKNIIRTVQQGF